MSQIASGGREAWTAFLSTCKTQFCGRKPLPGQTLCAVHKRQREKSGWASEPNTETETYIYVIRSGEDGPVKIGRAGNPVARLKELQTGNPERLMLMVAFRAAAEYETKLHEALAEHRISGEWFRWCDEVEFVVALAREGGMPNIQAFCQPMSGEVRKVVESLT